MQGFTLFAANVVPFTIRQSNKVLSIKGGNLLIIYIGAASAPPYAPSVFYDHSCGGASSA
jgi:hypothetical protein